MSNYFKTGAITSFRDEYAFLSNFYTSPFRWAGNEFHSGEQAFSFAKAGFAKEPGNVVAYQRRVLGAPTPGLAKREGRSMTINLDEWEKHKVQYMREIVHAKFSVSGMVGPLLNTGSTMLVEGNDWGDKFWGRVYEDGKWTGLNVLGVILMEERGYWRYV